MSIGIGAEELPQPGMIGREELFRRKLHDRAPALHAHSNEAARGAVPMAVSADGLLVLVVQVEPACLLVWRAGHDVPVHTIVPAARDGRVATRIAALHTAALRRSFIVAPADLPELWEISYDPKAEEIYDGLVHDYRFGEGVPRRGFLGLKRTVLPEPLADFVFDAGIGFPHIRSGKVKLLAVTSDRWSPFFPDAPTYADMGIQNAGMDVWFGLWARTRCRRRSWSGSRATARPGRGR